MSETTKAYVRTAAIRAFIRTAAIRAVKTFCQTLAAMLTAAGTGLLDTDWQTSLSVAGMACLLSVLTTLGGEWIAPSKAPAGELGGTPAEPDAEQDEAGAVSFEFVVGFVTGAFGFFMLLVLMGRL